MTNEQSALLAQFFGHGMGFGMSIAFVGGFLGYHFASLVIPALEWLIDWAINKLLGRSVKEDDSNANSE